MLGEFILGGIFTGSAVFIGARLRLGVERAASRAEAERLRHWLADTAQERDSALDALATIASLTDLDAVRAHASQALEIGHYTGRLRAAQNALDQAETELAELRAGGGVDEHADRVLAILRDTADQVEPATDALDRIRARLHKDHQ